MEIIRTSNAVYKNQIVALYIEAFSTGLSQQYVNPIELETYIASILENGYALLALENGQVIGALLCCPFEFDKLIPAEINQNFSIEKCVYVAEMMVSGNNREQGIGKKLMHEFFETVDKSIYSDSFIRVWDENIPALNLYIKVGFTPIATIQQTKVKKNGKETFSMQKIYLHKRLI
ncbi:MAG: GNAT family N-acetyltransferase [Paludibacter sp.]|nr:GNAT family N-acetyltransferase [Paludibacter sp.]